MESVLLSVFSSAVYSLLSKSSEAIYEDFKYIVSSNENAEGLNDEEIKQAFEIIEKENLNDEMSEKVIKRRLENSDNFMDFVKSIKVGDIVVKNNSINQSNIFGDNNISM